MTRKTKAQKERDWYYENRYILPPEADFLCLFRPCYNKYEKKGSFSQGVGYTSYIDEAKEFNPVCATRMSTGCPAWRDLSNDQACLAEALTEARDILTSEPCPRSGIGRHKRAAAWELLRLTSFILAQREAEKDG